MEESKQLEDINEEILNEDDEIIEESQEAVEQAEEPLVKLEELIEENEILIEKAEEKVKIDKEAEEKKANEVRLKEEARQQDLKDRYAQLHNAQIAAQQLGKSKADIYFSQHILASKSHTQAEQLLIELEKMDKECYEGQLFSENSFKRKVAYQEIDLMLLESIAEKEAGDDSKMKEYLSKREEIQKQFPIK